jgi:hypothetical protein
MSQQSKTHLFGCRPSISQERKKAVKHRENVLLGEVVKTGHYVTAVVHLLSEPQPS